MSKIDMRGLVIRDATRPLEIEITHANVAKATCGDEQQCVVAQAILAKFEGLAIGALVGPTVTKVVLDGCVLRYKTPAALRAGLTAFDNSRDENGKGSWHLPVGVYTLLVPAPTERLGKKRPPIARRGKKALTVKAKSLPISATPPRKVTRCPVVKTNRQVKQANRAA